MRRQYSAYPEKQFNRQYSQLQFKSNVDSFTIGFQEESWTAVYFGTYNFSKYNINEFYQQQNPVLKVKMSELLA